MLKRLKADAGLQCNAHSFRRGFCVHQVKSGLSTRDMPPIMIPLVKS
jgi:hypothetical protein